MENNQNEPVKTEEAVPVTEKTEQKKKSSSRRKIFFWIFFIIAAIATTALAIAYFGRAIYAMFQYITIIRSGTLDVPCSVCGKNTKVLDPRDCTDVSFDYNHVICHECRHKYQQEKHHHEWVHDVMLPSGRLRTWCRLCGEERNDDNRATTRADTEVEGSQW